MHVFVKVFLICISVFNVVSSVHPHLDEEWWGPTNLKWHNDTSIRPFQVDFHPEMIEDLRYRLLNHRPFTPPLEGVGFEYGFNTNYLHSWVDYWANNYNFKEREAVLNQFPQYKTLIQGLDIHFLWVRPNVPSHVKIIPLLLIHGWPGSVVEFFKTIPLLITPSKDRDFVVEIIAPTLPGFGFSDAAVRPGLGAEEMAVIFKNLMHRLGFKKYYVQGGDWGSFIGMTMATLYPKEVLGYHSNLPLALTSSALGLYLLGAVHPPLVMDPSLADRVYPLVDYLIWVMTEFGYFHIQAAKPDTLGVAMADSPAGLLAWIYQLFSSGTRRHFVRRPDGGLDDEFSRDELLDNLMMYWMTNCFTTSVRIYAETINVKNLRRRLYAVPTTVPTWSIHARHEITYQSPKMLKSKYPNLLHSTILPSSGHFLAFEEPDIFAADVLKALTTFEKWHNKHYYY